MKGLHVHVHVLRDSLGDHTNGGITSKHDSFTLTGQGVDGPFEPNDRAPELVLVLRQLGGRYGTYLHAEPAVQPTGMCGPMFGGNFIFSSDSRFPNSYPIPVHDRFETAEQNRILSS
jgi:hypothetical protein